MFIDWTHTIASSRVTPLPITSLISLSIKCVACESVRWSEQHWQTSRWVLLDRACVYWVRGTDICQSDGVPLGSNTGSPLIRSVVEYPLSQSFCYAIRKWSGKLGACAEERRQTTGDMSRQWLVRVRDENSSDVPHRFWLTKVPETWFLTLCSLYLDMSITPGSVCEAFFSHPCFVTDRIPSESMQQFRVCVCVCICITSHLRIELKHKKHSQGVMFFMDVITCLKCCNKNSHWVVTSKYCDINLNIQNGHEDHDNQFPTKGPSTALSSLCFILGFLFKVVFLGNVGNEELGHYASSLRDHWWINFMHSCVW